MLKIFNTMTQEKEFVSKEGEEIKIYNCGPTVYDYAHIGNFRSFIFYDLLRRYLEHIGFKVKQVTNITDVDDKTINKSQKLGMTLEKYTEIYTKIFLDNCGALRIEKSHIYPKATEHIEEMIDMIKILLKKGIAYRAQDGIYFSILKFPGYGKLSHLDISELKEGARVAQDAYDKTNAQDFALWKFWTEADGNVFWETDIGKGRPGWHIECSAMAQKYLDQIDIHTGGIDLVFPHHENEIAQSEAATGKQFVRYWVHAQHLLVDGKKMSKSLGNFYTLKDIESKGYDPVAFRYLCLSSHYRSQLNFTFESLENAKNTLDNLNDFLRRVDDAIEGAEEGRNEELSALVEETKASFEEYMNDDLNTPQALSVVFEMIKVVNRVMDENNASKESLQDVYDFMMEFNDIFDILDMEEKELTDEEKELIEKREIYRKEKNFGEADSIRKELAERGIILEDSPTGVRWKKN